MKRIIKEQPVSKTGNTIIWVMNKDRTAKGVFVNPKKELIDKYFESFESPINNK